MKLIFKLLKTLFVFVLLVLVLAAIAVYTLPREKIAESAVVSYLASNGVDNPRINIKRFGIGKIEAEDISAGSLNIKSANVEYEIKNWREIRINSVKLDGVSLDIEISGDNITAGGIENLAKKPEEPKQQNRFIPEVGFGEVVISDVSVSVENGRKFNFNIKALKGNIENQAAEFTIAINNMPISNLLADYGVEATGTVSGRIPVKIQNGKLYINKGKMKSDSNGTIKYQPATGAIPGQQGNQNISMINSLLENFNYDVMQVEIDGNTGGDQSIKISLNGNSPNVQEGRKVNFNINLEGNIVDIVKQSLDTYNLPETLIRKLQK